MSSASSRRNFVYKRDLLNKVLPDYKLVTDAPLRLEDFLGYETAFESGELASFEAAVVTEERRLKYKTIDADGNVFLVANPWARRVHERDDGSLWVIHPKPKLVMTFAEAKQRAKEFDAKARQISDLEGDDVAEFSDTEIDD